MEKIKIKYVNLGLGVYIHDTKTIYLNRCLQNNRKAYDKVLNHELYHTERKDMLTDIAYDLKPDIWLFWYSLNHPSTWTSLLPIQKIGGLTIFNPINTVLYLTAIILIGGLTWITY